MMRPSRTLVSAAFLAGAVAGCATLYGTRDVDPEERLAMGLNALKREDYRTAFDALVQVYTHHPTEPAGHKALLALAASELDPRNPSRRMDVGSDLAARYLSQPDAPAWTEPVAETLYLLALELGAAEMRVAEAEAERAEARSEAREAREEARRARAATRPERHAAGAATARPLPQLPGPPVTARIRELERERDRLAGRVTQLEQELERIRRTLRP